LNFSLLPLIRFLTTLGRLIRPKVTISFSPRTRKIPEEELQPLG
jgi:hypothetical protein